MMLGNTLAGAGLGALAGLGVRGLDDSATYSPLEAALTGAGIGGGLGGMGMAAASSRAMGMERLAQKMAQAQAERTALEGLLKRIEMAGEGFAPQTLSRTLRPAEVPGPLGGLGEGLGFRTLEEAMSQRYPQDVLDAIQPILGKRGGVNPAWLGEGRNVGTIASDRESVLQALTDMGLGGPHPTDPRMAQLSLGVASPSDVPGMGVYGGRLGAARTGQADALTGGTYLPPPGVLEVDRRQDWPSLASLAYGRGGGERELADLIGLAPGLTGQAPGISRPLHVTSLPLPQAHEATAGALGQTLARQAGLDQEAQVGPLSRALYALATGRRWAPHIPMGG